jgi:hypothetical protein
MGAILSHLFKLCALKSADDQGYFRQPSSRETQP